MQLEKSVVGASPIALCPKSRGSFVVSRGRRSLLAEALLALRNFFWLPRSDGALTFVFYSSKQCFDLFLVSFFLFASIFSLCLHSLSPPHWCSQSGLELFVCWQTTLACSLCLVCRCVVLFFIAYEVVNWRSRELFSLLHVATLTLCAADVQYLNL